MKNLFLFLSFVLLLSGLCLAEYSGNITLTTIVTGVYGSSLSGICNNTWEHCIAGDRCAYDYDNSWYGSKGNCTTDTTTCFDDGIWRAHAYKFCDGSVLAECSSGSWNSVVCSNGCANSTCLTTTTTITSAPVTTSTISDYAMASIQITIYPNDFNITQNQTIIKTVEVKNNGELDLYNITLNVNGVDSSWLKVTPTKYTSLSINAKTTYTVKFSIPSNATVDTYVVVLEVTTSNSSVSAAKNFNLRILPSTETVTGQIIPSYQSYMDLLDNIENNITSLEAMGINTSEIRAIFDQIKSKLNQTNASIENTDYFTANQLLQDVENLIDDINTKIQQARAPGIDIFIIIIIVVVAIAIVIAYLFWPVEQKTYRRQITEKQSIADRIVNEVKKVRNLRNRNKSKAFTYRYKR